MPSPSQLETSVLVVRLERCWRAIQARHRDLPGAIIIVASGQERGRLVKHGHWSPARWVVEEGRVPEVLIAGETLNRDPVAVFGTLLHEAAHGLAFARKVADTSREGRYHNALYKKIAEEVGLTVKKDAVHGWTVTALAPATITAYQGCIDELRALPKSRRRLDHGDPGDKKPGEDEDGEGEGGEDGEGKGKKESRSLLATCGCGRKVRGARKTIEAGLIACGLCHRPFLLAPSDIDRRTVVVGLSVTEAAALLDPPPNAHPDDETEPATILFNIVRRAHRPAGDAWYQTLQLVGTAAAKHAQEARLAEHERQADAGEATDWDKCNAIEAEALAEALSVLYPAVTGRPWSADYKRELRKV